VLGVNSKVQLAELERVAQRSMAEALMEQGVRLADPARIDVRGDRCSAAATCSSTSIACSKGMVVLDEAVEVGPNCVLKNARIGAGTRLAAFTHIEDAVVGADGVIGPFARLRPGTELAEDVHVGNFVEIKKSRIAAHSKANHLAYIGDAIDRQPGERRRRDDHLQLRRRQQVQDDHRGRCLHRLGYPVGGAGYCRSRRHPGRRNDADQGRAADTLTISRARQVHSGVETCHKSKV
jgi:carbonic anhydrase/acetyltransferase-like protein (isoleucine patch superfamily)